MPDAKFTSAFTGQQVESAIKKALPLDSFEHSSDEVIDGKVFHVLWKVTPTTSNLVSGITIHPETGRMCEVVSANGAIALYRYVTDNDFISLDELDTLFK